MQLSTLPAFASIPDPAGAVPKSMIAIDGVCMW